VVRKVIYSVAVVCLVLALLELAVRLWNPRIQEERARYFPDLKTYLKHCRESHAKLRVIDKDDRVMVRVAKGTPGATEHTEGGYVVPLTPARFPAGTRRVFIIGGSAAYGFFFPYHKTFGGLLESKLRAGLHTRGVHVLNIANPGWDLQSQVLRLKHALRRLQGTPDAVVVYAGNNESPPYWRPPKIGWRPWRRLFAFRVLKAKLLPPKPPDEPADPFTTEDTLRFIWLPSGGLDNASFWPEERKIYFRHFRSQMRDILGYLHRRHVFAVLVPLPINPDAFDGHVTPQPMTFRPVGAAEHRRLADKLARAMHSDPPDQSLVEEVVREAPDGPLQLWILGRMLDREGRHAEALRYLMRSRANWWGMGFGMPTMAAIAREQGKSPDVALVDTRNMYDPRRSIRQQAAEMFLDGCHLNGRGHRLLADAVTSHLLPELRSVGTAGR
jgi:lysophospholipase L1-like esterase